MGKLHCFPAAPILVFMSAVLMCLLSEVNAQQAWSRWKRQVPPHEWNPWRSPLERFDKYVHVQLDFYGEFVKGFSIPMYLEDTVWDPDWSEYPQWFLRRINCFLGIPYAMAPIGERRFQVNNIPLLWMVCIRCDEIPHRAHCTTSRRERQVTGRFAPSSVHPIGRI